jgi:hypothetical protein
MGLCLSWYKKQKLVRPSCSTSQNPQRHLIQSRVLNFTYKSLCQDRPIDGVYCIGLTDPTAGWRCINCAMFATDRDFTFRVGPENKVQFQIPLCERCRDIPRLQSIILNKIYTPEQTQFHAFLHLSIVCDLLEIHRIFAKPRNPDGGILSEPQLELMLIT